ncbi:hypothetical protein ACYVL9_001767 [Vibrio fluvialis]
MKMPDPFHLLVLVIFSLVFFVLGAFITGGIMSTSVSLTDAPANWVSAIGTAMAALGTVLTLGFLIYQNIELRRSQQEETLKREAHEEKQQNMWNEQREMLVFQKLQTHKSLFNDLLDELEKRFCITFFDRTGLYKKIFPSNGFNQFSAVVHPKSIKDIEAGTLQDCKSLHNRVIASLMNYEKIKSKDFVHDHLHDLLSFSSLLHLTLPNQHHFGDVTCRIGSEDLPLTNIFNPNETIFIFEQVLQRLCDFAELEHISSNMYWGGGYYKEALLDFFLRINYLEYTVHLGEIRGLISGIYENFVKHTDDSWKSTPSVRGALSHIKLFFREELKDTTEEDVTNKLLLQTKDLYQALEEHYMTPSLLTDKQEQTLKILKSTIHRLSKRLDILQKGNRG